ncbi:peptidoglycan-binding protein [Bradyrhizobium lablabi]|uniref:Peptidoglycan-binding protein n=1 Tax=Bradyrhizobium lablabi TaxID=722472 RepID=A0A0R3N2D4_9BRAD|nr:L,D-transpeptidase family protein [Bradyrhizobium lablabi]KRR24016.1 peptidoglycan-binding protein [Bradyrhizobium lablabi]
MRDCSTNRAGFDRVLMAVAATFLTVSATSALAGQSTTPRASAAELAIDAAVPRPEPANVPPPTIGDFKVDSTASVPDAAKAVDKPAETKPAETVTAPAAKPDDATVTPPAATATAPAAEPAKEPVKVSTVAPADQPVAERLRDMIGTKSLRYFDRKNERAAVEKFYTARDYAPQWTQAGKLTDSGKGVIARLKDAASEGLNPADYPVPDFASAAASPDQLAEAELKLTASMLDYARQAQSGRMHWSQVSADIQYPEHPTDPAEVLANISTAKDASAALDGYNPPHKLYKELKAKLAELRGQGDGPMAQIAEGPALAFKAATKKQGEVAPEDSRVPQLRAKLGVENHDDARYDAKVAAAVRKFQESADLKPTGVLDDRTVKALNSPKRDRQIDTVLVNMERWRWLPRQLGASSLGNAYVILNVPDFTLKVMQNGHQVWNTRVVTGKPGKHATPMLTETMKFITVNPTWNVPPSIIYNEYLPALQQDPTVLQRMGLRLERNRDGSIHISQPPGEANALGRVRFNFPNKFLVYQHDTPDKHLFAKEERAFSHGCMRVQNPDQYAATLLNITMPNERYTPERIRGMYGRSEIDLKFPTPIPVNITYQTAFVDDAGKLQIRKDIYGRDSVMIALLKNSRSKDLEALVAHAQPSYTRPSGSSLPAGVNFASDNTYSSGPSFFERLFGGPSPVTPPAPVGRRPQPRFTR